MRITSMKTVLATTLGLLLIAGQTAYAQRKDGRKRKERPKRAQKRDTQPRKKSPPRPKGPPGKTDVPRPKTVRPPVRTQPKRGNVQPKRGKRGPVKRGPFNRGPGGRGSANHHIGRRWVLDSRRGNRSDLYRRRSTELNNRLRTGITTGGANINAGSRRTANRRTNDWRNWQSDYYTRHRWYRGSWGGNWYGNWSNRWWRSWRRYPVAISFGLTPWGLNRMGYWFGYNNYYNPYYYQPLVIGSTTIDYSQPLVAAPPAYEANATFTDFDRARDAFKRKQYERSLTLVNRAITEHPRDATLHEFRALALFALADYRQAAQTLNPVLSVGPGWDWPTLRGLYSGVAEYTKQLRALEGFVGDHKGKAYGHFLLGYHYLTMGHDDDASKQFQRTVALAPKDQVSRQILSMLDQNAKIAAPSHVPTAKSNIDADDLVGTWNAKRGNADFQLQLSRDRRFTWTHREGKRSTSVAGAFAVNNGTLALEPQAGGVMLANVQLNGKDRLHFQMVGSGPKDPGLTFSR